MAHSHILRVLFTLLCFCLAFPSSAETAKFQILTSIKPLAMIAHEVVHERAEVKTLLPVAASPHDYPLKVSDIRLLHQVDLVLWVGPELEAFLQRPLTNLAFDKQLSVYHLSGLRWPVAEPEANPQPQEHNDTHQHHQQDPHLWLDPHNAVVIAHAIAERMATIQPANAEFYKANAARFAQQMHLLDQHIAEQLEPVRNQGFAVYHEGYLHFVNRYQLRQAGFVTYIPERRPGARHLHQLRQALKGEAVCLFIEPYYDPRSARELGGELGLKIGVLDPIGGEHINTYSELMEAMMQDFLTCLTQA